MASVSRLGWLLLVIPGCLACEEPYEPGDPRINAPINLRNDHEGSTIAAFGVEVEEGSRTPCEHASDLFSVDVRLVEAYGLDSCLYEEQTTFTIFESEDGLEVLEKYEEEGGALISLQRRDESSAEQLGCGTPWLVQWMSPVEDYAPLTTSEMVMILRDDHDVVCSSSGEQLE